MITGTGTGHITRPTTLGNFVDFTKDWTRSQYVKFPSASTGSNYYTVWFDSDGPADNFIELYAWLAGGVGAFSLTLDVKIATTLHSEILSAPISTATNVYCTIRYTATTHLLEMLIDGVVVDSATLSLATISGIATDIMLNDSGGLASGSIGYDGIWQKALLNSEITAQMSSTTVVNSTGLITYCPLQTSIDLTAHNNTLTVFTASGTVTTNTTDPLLSVVAGPPTNTTPTLATTVTTDSAYFQDVNTTGAATNVWHKCTAIKTQMGAMAFGDLVTYKPTIRVYEGLANANSNTPMPNISHNLTNAPIQFPTTIGLDYYFQSVRNGAVSASTLQISVLNGLDLAVPSGSFAVNDDAPALPLVILDRITAYPIKFVNPFPAGEGGSVLPSGIAVVTDDDDVSGGSNITTVNGIAIATTTSTLPDSGYQCASDDQAHTFYAGSFNAGASGHSKIISISDAGIIGATSWDLPQSGIYTLGVNKEDSIAYYGVSNSTAQPIHRFDLVNNIALTDLVTGPAGHVNCKDIIVLSDDSILILFNQNATSLLLNQYSAAGSLVLSTNLGSNTAHSIDARLARAIETGHIWVWQKLNSPASYDIFLRVRISDGAVIETTPNSAEFEGGMNQTAQSNTPIRFGHSESCPFWVIQSGVTPSNAKSGLYILTGTGGDFGLPDNPILRHDVDWIDTSLGTSESVKIPDPYYDTYLVGDE